MGRVTCKQLGNVYDINLPKEDLDRLNKVVDFIKSYNFRYNCDVYLFGSFAKGKIKDSSDIDLLMIVDLEDKRLVRRQKLDFIDMLEDTVNLYYGDDFDLLVYTEATFLRALEKEGSFEYSVNSYMLKIERG